MLPCYAIKYTGNLPLRHAILSSESGMSDTANGIPCADFGNLFSRQFGPAICFTRVTRLATLLLFVCHVVVMSAKQKMGRVNASRIITLVHNMQAIWNGSISQNPHATMGALHFSVVGSYLPVAAVAKTNPGPTIVRAALVNMFPKAFSQWAARGWVMAFDVFVLVSTALGFGDRLIAATSAKNGIIEGHQNLQFWCLIRERFAVAARYFRVYFSFKYSTSRRIFTVAEELRT